MNKYRVITPDDGSHYIEADSFTVDGQGFLYLTKAVVSHLSNRATLSPHPAETIAAFRTWNSVEVWHADSPQLELHRMQQLAVEDLKIIKNLEKENAKLKNSVSE